MWFYWFSSERLCGRELLPAAPSSSQASGHGWGWLQGGEGGMKTGEDEEKAGGKMWGGGIGDGWQPGLEEGGAKPERAATLTFFLIF